MEDVGLRGYQPGDLQAMFALDQACFAAAFRFTKAAMRGFAEARNARVVLGVAGEALAGFVILHLERARGERVGYLVTLDVAESYRRRGLARRLVRAAEGSAVEEGCAALVLHVFAGNEAAITFYEREGFARVGRAADFYGRGLEALLYRKPLAKGERGSEAS